MKKFSFKFKLISLCILMAAVSSVIGLTAYYGLHSVSDQYSNVSDSALPKLELVDSMFLSYSDIRIHLRTLGLPGLSAEEAESAVKDVKATIAGYEKYDNQYSAMPFYVGEKELYEQVNKNWIIFKGVGERVLALHQSGKPEDKEKILKIFLKDCPEAAEAYRSSMEKLVSYQKRFSSTMVQEARATVGFTNLMISLIGTLGVAIGLLVGYLFSTSMARSITQIVDSLNENAQQLTAVSSQIASSSEELSQSATEQAASLEQTAASIEEMDSMVAKNTDNSKATAATSSLSQKKATEGKAVVEKMILSMDQINQSNNTIMEQVNHSNEQLASIVKVIEEIGSKTRVINDIVFQTKLLSFNASVEAARAGEHGKGFAVVAEEVGNLAQMSGNAAKEISALLDDSVRKVNSIVSDTRSKVEKLIGEGRQTVEVGARVARECGDVLEEIVQNVSNVAVMANEISSASNEQSRGVSEITKAMNQLNQVTQSNAATSEEAASAAEELAAQAESLKKAVEDLAEAIHGGHRQVSDESKGTSASDQRESSGEAKPRNVVHIKSARKSQPIFPTQGFKKAAGDSTPGYDDEGFRDV